MAVAPFSESASNADPKGSKTGSVPRVRIAPSPTGDPHVGTAYIGLFNYVFAKKHGGQFILRIEDTDQERSSQHSEQAILDALRWVGLNWDEGPDISGPHGPYRQSERLEIYRKYVDLLVEKGAAYRCLCDKARLDALREEQKANKSAYGYDGHCRGVDPQEAKRRADAGEPYVVRLAVPKEGQTSFTDGLRGEITFEHHTIDDQVLLKSDGFPTYHLANVVDDHLMGITHVIRGEEWITSTPKHILLYQAFGWEPPEFIHLGLLRNADKSKLSKRKNPVSVFHYRDLGYFPETFVNFLATLGFSMGEDRERFSLQEMIDAFEWSKVSSGGPVFDVQKLEAFNADDLRAMAPEALYQSLMERVFQKERIVGLLSQVQERITRMDDFVPYASFFFGDTLDYSSVASDFRIKKRSRDEIVKIMKMYLEAIEKDPVARSFDAEGLDAFSRAFCKEQGWKPREIFTLLRLCCAGRKAAPPVFETMALCGKDRCRARIRDAMRWLSEQEEF